jgi:Aldehyde dehydrogenase family
MTRQESAKWRISGRRTSGGGGSRIGNGGCSSSPPSSRASVQTFETREEAVSMANDTTYRLSGMVWSLNINNALQTVRAIRAGRCWVNGTREGLVEMPIGGYKQSGQGRELGHKGFDEYSEFKNIYVNLGVSPPWPPAQA